LVQDYDQIAAAGTWPTLHFFGLIGDSSRAVQMVAAGPATGGRWGEYSNISFLRSQNSDAKEEI
jgi:hypothetical protein